MTVRVARDHASAIRPGRDQARREAISDILASLLPKRRDRQCERVKKPPRNTFTVKKRGQTPPGSKATYTITITKKKPLPADTPYCNSPALQAKGTFSYDKRLLVIPGESPSLGTTAAILTGSLGPRKLMWYLQSILEVQMAETVAVAGLVAH